jgi:hypothetical protein
MRVHSIKPYTRFVTFEPPRPCWCERFRRVDGVRFLNVRTRRHNVSTHWRIVLFLLRQSQKYDSSPILSFLLSFFHRITTHCYHRRHVPSSSPRAAAAAAQDDDVVRTWSFAADSMAGRISVIFFTVRRVCSGTSRRRRRRGVQVGRPTAAKILPLLPFVGHVHLVWSVP